LTLSIIFFAFGAYGIFVFSAICISSIETKGGILRGSFAINGKVKIPSRIITK